MAQAIAIIIAGALIAGAIVLTNRWEIAATSNSVARLDRWTGKVTGCTGDLESLEGYQYDRGVKLLCDD